MTRLPGFAISGKAGSGKSTAARFIEEALWNLGYMESARLAFADALKAECFERTGLTKNDPGGRDALLELGRQMRGVDENVFVNILSVRRDLLDDGVVPIVEDVRYPNELAWCVERRMYLIRLEASPAVRRGRLAHLNHEVSIVDLYTESECGLDSFVPDGFDRVIENDGYGVSPFAIDVCRAVCHAIEKELGVHSE